MTKVTNVTYVKNASKQKWKWNCTAKLMMATNHINARPAVKPSESVDSLKLTKKGILKTDLTNVKNA